MTPDSPCDHVPICEGPVRSLGQGNSLSVNSVSVRTSLCGARLPKYLLKGFDASTLPGVMGNMGKHENVVEHEEACYSEGEDLLADDALGDIFDFRAATLTCTVYEAVKVLQLASRDSRRRICMRCSFASRREHIEAFLLGEFVNKLKRLPASRFQLPHRPPSRQSSANSSPCSV